MKKILIFILITAICLSFLSITPLASVNKNELNAEQLVREALFVFHHHAYEIYLDLGIRGEKKNEKPNIDDSYMYDIVDPSKLIGGSLDGFYNHLGMIYTESLVHKYTQTGYLMDSPMFIIEDDGDVFKVWEAPMNEKFDRLSYQSATVEIIENDGNRAKAKVYLEINVYEFESTRCTPTDAWIECIFENTSSGWRISDCAFFDMLNSHKSNFEWTPVESPSTGDVSGERVAVIGAVSLACIIPTACLMRRRRRASAE